MSEIIYYPEIQQKPDSWLYHESLRLEANVQNMTAKTEYGNVYDLWEQMKELNDEINRRWKQGVQVALPLPAQTSI